MTKTQPPGPAATPHDHATPADYPTAHQPQPTDQSSTPDSAWHARPAHQHAPPTGAHPSRPPRSYPPYPASGTSTPQPQTTHHPTATIFRARVRCRPGVSTAAALVAVPGPDPP
ncbi:hypothetical protein BZL29_2203 [Mycobacterium kansasii]|uniref:Uncharacterized protein n=1 Tax=Mycobacterium kansasii TaxID=1768 RepID=A0A1V3XM04_MYCKA|nr:hypothetical protein BZL29_2203 [Mycobacterium kansasii]